MTLKGCITVDVTLDEHATDHHAPPLHWLAAALSESMMQKQTGDIRWTEGDDWS